jgi:peptide/nickel transport system substrate-binding protein
VTAGTLLAGCQIGSGPGATPATPSGTPKPGGTVIVAAGPVGTLENSLNLGVPTPRYLYEIYDRLVYEDLAAEAETPPIVPGLAESWDVSSDAKVYTFKLRQNVKFHDGTPFDADAVKFNIERLTKRDHPYYYERGAGVTKAGWGRVIASDVVDKYMIRLTLNAPYAHLTDLLARAEYSIASPENIKRVGNDKNGDSPVGTGPFKFVSHQQGSRLELARNPDYWRGAPLLDGIVVRTIKEPSAAVSALLAGEVHLVADMVTPDLAKSLQSNANLAIKLAKTPGVDNFVLNAQQGPLSDKRARQALNYAIDRESFVRDLLLGLGTVSKSFFAPSASAYNSGLKGYSYDPDRAKALLREAGLSAGSALKFYATTQEKNNPYLVYMRDSLTKLGIEMKTERFEAATMVANFNREGTPPGVDGIFVGWQTTPAFNFDRFFWSGFAPPNGNNLGFYRNPEVDRLITQAGATTDGAERIKIYQRAEEVVTEDAPQLWLTHGPNDPRASVRNLHWVNANSYNYTLRNAYFE